MRPVLQIPAVRRLQRGATLALLGAALLGPACGPAAEPAQEAGRPPNVLILMADDWNWPQSEGVSDPNLRTPTFDRIAAEGVRFRNAFVDSPSCTPSRAALLTGMRPWMLETGVHLWGALPAKFETYTDLLEGAGYLVGYSGKGWGPGYLVEARRQDNPAGRIVVGDPPGRAWDSRDRVATFEEFLARRDEGQPFHFWFNTSEPHRPYDWQSGLRRGMSLDDVVVPPTLPDTEETRTDLADYYYEVESFDAAAARLMAHLEEIGELENTIVVMTGDNGMPFPRAKMTLYDLGTRVPLAVRWPARGGGGRVVDDFVTFSDLAPTFLQAAGVAPPAAMSGRSFLAAIESDESGLLDAERTRAFSSIELHCGRYPMRGIRTPDYLFVRNYEPERPVNVCADYWEGEAGYSPTWISVLALDEASDMYQRIVGARPAEELYDLAADPYQLDNVAGDAAYASVRESLAGELDAELRRTGDPRVDGRHEEVFYIPHQENARLRDRSDALMPSAAALEAHMRFLASDSLRGREPGTEGFDVAAAYVENEFRLLELRPAGDDGSFLQPVPLQVSRRDTAAARMEIRTSEGVRTLTSLEDFVIDAEPAQPSSAVTAAVVFAGFGIEAPDLGVDDYQGLDVEGKIVLTFAGAPGHLPTDEKAHLSRDETKARTADAHGAVGMLRVYPTATGQPDPFARAARGAEAGSMSWVAADGRGHDPAPGLRAGAVVSARTAELLFEGAARPFSEVSAAIVDSQAGQVGDEMPGGAVVGFDLPVEVSLSQASRYDGFASPNVVALLPGSDPRLRGEHVVITAHLDHVGVGRPDATGDDIYNGAGDNASGTAVLLEIARLLAANPARRSVVFVAATAEERGLVGSDYFAHNPPVPIDSIIANINLDSGVFLYDFTDIIPFGTLHSSLDDNVRRVAAQLGLEVGTDPLPDEALFTRSDHYRFVQQGIPSMFFMCGMTARDPSIDGLTELRRYVAEHLHRPSDEIDLPWDYTAAARYAGFVAEVSRDVADTEMRPTWNEGGVFSRIERR